ncbi:hypothetical protein K439DRAFT_1348493 [Ramaria rubella]|nr:hypothetical protein K439DRAFT_1348493 [Ramaria rubella]
MTASFSPISAPYTIETIPAELLQQIAFFVAASELKGPPSDLVHLCCTSSTIYASLRFADNPSLYASIFRYKFDFTAPMRRLGPERITASALAIELRNRFESMKRIRAGMGSRPRSEGNREHDLWMAIFLMLENDGKNAVQLKHFAFVEQWLLDFFLDHSGGSYASDDIYAKHWPRDNQDNRLAMWLLWLCDRTSLNYSSTIRRMYCDILRAYAVAANKYPLTAHPWTDYTHPYTVPTTTQMVYTHYGLSSVVVSPAISIPAILGYMSRMHVDTGVVTFDTEASTATAISHRWDCDWERCIVSKADGSKPNLERVYRPGTLEGAWEGLFTYTEFTVYAAILSGAPPQTLYDGAIGQNIQIWKLREYNLYSESLYSQKASQNSLPIGDAFDAFFPQIIIDEKDDHAIFAYGSEQSKYFRYLHEPTKDNQKLCDVVVLGEGHSSWGDFELRGRVRASDGLVTVLKQYVSHETESRAKWIYRGYLVGGKLVGRWRDALTPLRLDGYEGAFELNRRM